MSEETKDRWFVVCGDPDIGPEDGGEHMAIWTVSLDPVKPGWTTDLGYRGYGLTKKLAQELADAANEKAVRK
jgi:hypothetical protein